MPPPGHAAPAEGRPGGRGEALRHLLPDSWDDARPSVAMGGVELAELAERFGTPLFVTDEAHLLARLAAFRAAFGPETTLVYAGKAFLCGALVAHLDEAGWWIDVVSGGELELALRAGMPGRRLLMHGNAKPRAELARAVEAGVGRVVVDHPGEVTRLAELAEAAGTVVDVLVRLNADVAAVTHEKVKTTGSRAQFGMDAATASGVVRAVADAPGLSPAGVHLHAGSQIRDLDTFRRAAAAVVEFVEPLRGAFADTVDLDLGGGMAVPYREEDPAADIAAFAGAVLGGLDAAGATERLGAWRLLVEPGRSVVATSTVTLYRAEARKGLPDGREVVAVDGGLSDNPRPSLYGQRYEVLSVDRAREPHDTPVQVVGRHCETGDLIDDGAALPADTSPGDLLAVPVTGAYAYSMSSRYNGLARPAVVFVRDGRARPVVRRETVEDLLACDQELPISGG